MSKKFYNASLSEIILEKFHNKESRKKMWKFIMWTGLIIAGISILSVLLPEIYDILSGVPLWIIGAIGGWCAFCFGILAWATE
jgi:hypothetical protein